MYKPTGWQKTLKKYCSNCTPSRAKIKGFKATGGQDSGFQVHYASVDHIPREGDDSGVFLQYTEKVTPRHMTRNSYFQFVDQQSAWQRCNRRCPEQQEFFWWVLAAQRPPTPPLTSRVKNLSLVPVSLNLLWGFKRHFHFPMFRFLKFLFVLSISQNMNFILFPVSDSVRNRGPARDPSICI